jgi:hypothetical protein
LRPFDVITLPPQILAITKCKKIKNNCFLSFSAKIVQHEKWPSAGIGNHNNRLLEVILEVAPE